MFDSNGRRHIAEIVPQKWRHRSIENLFTSHASKQLHIAVLFYLLF